MRERELWIWISLHGNGEATLFVDRQFFLQHVKMIGRSIPPQLTHRNYPLSVIKPSCTDRVSILFFF